MNNATNNEQSFINYILHNRGKKFLLSIIVLVLVIQFAILKYYFPYINFLYEYSFQQLEEAASNTAISITPIGYPKFLRLISIFTYSDTILAAIQYFLIEASALIFISTIFYFYKPIKLIQYFLLCFVVFNPLFLQLGNLLTRDGLFASLSMIWFSLLLWIIQRPSNKIILWHMVVVFLAFTIRYQAIIYPIISCFAFGISNMQTRKKLAGASLGFLIVCGVSCYQGFQNKKLTGQWQPAPNIGWLLANNAIFMYKHINYDQRRPVNIKHKDLDKIVRRYLNSSTNIMFYPREINEAGNLYLWHSQSPLYKYADTFFKQSNDTLASPLKKWLAMAPKYASYGSYLIQKYPIKYLVNYAAYGIKNYYIPPLEYLESYYGGRKEIADIAKNWFRFKSNKVTTRTANIENLMLHFYPFINSITNIIMLFGLLYYMLLKGWKHNYNFNKIILFAAVVWFINALFTILLTTSALRLQAFPILLTTTFSLLLLDWMVQLMKTRIPIEKDKQLEVSFEPTPKIR